MLSQSQKNVLNYLNLNSNESGYNIFSIKEIASSVNMESGSVLECIGQLEKADYVLIKYQDVEQVLLSISLKGKLFEEKMIEGAIEKKSNKKTAFICSFFGSFLGTGLSLILYNIVVFLLEVR